MKEGNHDDEFRFTAEKDGEALAREEKKPVSMVANVIDGFLGSGVWDGRHRYFAPATSVAYGEGLEVRPKMGFEAKTVSRRERKEPIPTAYLVDTPRVRRRSDSRMDDDLQPEATFRPGL